MMDSNDWKHKIFHSGVNAMTLGAIYAALLYVADMDYENVERFKTKYGEAFWEHIQCMLDD